ncbi:DDE superfamily endonuclease [Hirsutella rhossiliensis]
MKVGKEIGHSGTIPQPGRSRKSKKAKSEERGPVMQLLISKELLQRAVSKRVTQYLIDCAVNNLKLTATEETALVQWILSMDERGMPPTVAYTRRMANLLLTERGKDPVGENWVRKFVGRHGDIKAKVFDPNTRRRTVGTHRLLILDGHGSHVRPEFDKYCTANSIVVLQMPAHSSHLLQPLDVRYYSPLKTIYGRKVQEKMLAGIHHIDKQDFLPIYLEARRQALSPSNIRSGFMATGLFPFDPNGVLSRLQVGGEF